MSARSAGRCALYAPVRGVCCSALSMTQMEVETARRKVIIDSFSKDKWLVTWSSAEADWYPAFPPRAFITPSGLPHALIGPAAPLPTDQAGIYWHKGGHYHDLRVTIPFTLDQLAGQMLHLAANYDEKGGYRVLFGKDNGQGTATLQRSGVDIGELSLPGLRQSAIASSHGAGATCCCRCRSWTRRERTRRRSSPRNTWSLPIKIAPRSRCRWWGSP